MKAIKSISFKVPFDLELSHSDNVNLQYYSITSVEAE